MLIVFSFILCDNEYKESKTLKPSIPLIIHSSQFQKFLK